ncbi:MAG: HAD-IIA family hydrolase [Chloroflexota bacterium]
MSIADLYDAILLDLDGVVYVGATAVPGAPAAIAELRRRGKQLLFVTNDARRTRRQYAEKLAALGVPATPADVLSAGAAMAAYMAQRHTLAGRRAFAIGPAALREELAATGLTLLEGDEGRAADFVCVAFHEEFHYRELLIATQALRRGALLYGTNRDTIFPMPDGPWPATGAVLAAVEVGGGVQAVVVGKPELPMFEVARGLLPAEARLGIVGDSLFSDIRGGLRAGIGTVLVLSGNTLPGDLQTTEHHPDHVVGSLPDIL